MSHCHPLYTPLLTFVRNWLMRVSGLGSLSGPACGLPLLCWNARDDAVHSSNTILETECDEHPVRPNSITQLKDETILPGISRLSHTRWKVLTQWLHLQYLKHCKIEQICLNVVSSLLDGDTPVRTRPRPHASFHFVPSPRSTCRSFLVSTPPGPCFVRAPTPGLEVLPPFFTKEEGGAS